MAELVSPDFGHWLAGFVDGEGCFYISPHHHHGRYSYTTWQCEFSLTLRADDIAILNEIVARTGIGKVSRAHPTSARLAARPGSREVARWTVRNRADCAALARLFHEFPLRAKKCIDFEIWELALKEWFLVRYGYGGAHRLSWMHWARMEALAEALTTGRGFDSGLSDPVDVPTPQLSIFSETS